MSTSVASTVPVVKHALGLSVVLSVLMIVAGCLAILVPPLAGIGVTILVGWLLVFSGGAHLVYAWHARGFGGHVWELLLGILYIAVGVYVLFNPVAGLASLTLALAVYLLIEAALEFALGFQLRPMAGTGWLLVDGLITLVLAAMIWWTWPSNTEWVIGLLVGVSMLFSGCSRWR